MPVQADTVSPHYLRALDEVYRLRQALAYEAGLLESCLAASSLRPLCVRRELERQVYRMTWAAQGGVSAAYEAVLPQDLYAAMHEAAMSATLTVEQWENPLAGDAVPRAVDTRRANR